VTAQVHDALVVGGGPAGAAAALLLAQAGWSVVVVERSVFPRKKVCGEYLSATNLPLLDRLGIGALFREQAGPPVRKVGLFAGKTIVEADLPRPVAPLPSQPGGGRRSPTMERTIHRARRRPVSLRSAMPEQRDHGHFDRPNRRGCAWFLGHGHVGDRAAAPAGGAVGFTRVQGPFRGRQAGPGHDAAAGIPGRIRRHGTLRGRPYQSFLLSAPGSAQRAAPALPSRRGRCRAGPHRRAVPGCAARAGGSAPAGNMVGRRSSPARPAPL
jgi:hypothetical protein